MVFVCEYNILNMNPIYLLIRLVLLVLFPAVFQNTLSSKHIGNKYLSIDLEFSPSSSRNLSYKISYNSGDSNFVSHNEGKDTFPKMIGRNNFRDQISIPVLVNFMDRNVDLVTQITTFNETIGSNAQVNSYITNISKAFASSTTRFQRKTVDVLLKQKIKLYKLPLDDPNDLRTCQCSNYNCSCCMHTEMEKIKLNATTCLSLAYLTKDYGLSIILSINGRVVYENTVSARNPPPICFAVPYLEEFASLCLEFYDLQFKEKELDGCAKIIGKLAHVSVGVVRLGCFHFG